MQRSMRAHVRTYAHFAGISLLALSVNSSVSPAQTAGQTPAATPTPGIRPPVARQIEPMVAPIRRVTPKQAASSAQPTPVAAAALPAKATPTTTAPTTTATAIIAPGPVPQQAPQQIAATPKSKLPPAGQAVAQPPSKTPKITVHTCKIGQDYSEKLKSCFTPGATSRVVNAAKSARNKLGSSIENVTRSALGAKRKN